MDTNKLFTQEDAETACHAIEKYINHFEGFVGLSEGEINYHQECPVKREE